MNVDAAETRIACRVRPCSAGSSAACSKNSGHWSWPVLRNLDPRCASLDYIVDESRAIQTEYVMSNNFAFGGINTSLVFRRAQ
jgi:hypothetical protein